MRTLESASQAKKEARLTSSVDILSNSVKVFQSLSKFLHYCRRALYQCATSDHFKQKSVQTARAIAGIQKISTGRKDRNNYGSYIPTGTGSSVLVVSVWSTGISVVLQYIGGATVGLPVHRHYHSGACKKNGFIQICGFRLYILAIETVEGDCQS